MDKIFAKIFSWFDTKPKIPSDKFRKLRAIMKIDDILKIAKRI